MTDYVTKAGLQVDGALAAFLEAEVLAPLGRDAEAFWRGFADLLAAFAPRNRALLQKRADLQAQIDAWHIERRGQPLDLEAYCEFLKQIRYLVPEPGEFTIGTRNVDP
ncbi:MAG: malate synthase G, partial [Tsuneonella sp.]